MWNFKKQVSLATATKLNIIINNHRAYIKKYTLSCNACKYYHMYGYGLNTTANLQGLIESHAEYPWNHPDISSSNACLYP